MTGFNDLLDTDETGDDVATPAAEVETEGTQDSQEPIPVVEAEKTVPLKALESERGKRQGYENVVAQQQQQIDILMRQIASQQQPQPQPQQQPVDILLNPDEWQNRLFGAIESVVQQQTFNRTLALSEEAARDRYADYDELIDGYFKPAAARQPELVQALYKAADPAKYAYKQARRLKLESEEGELDYDKLKEKLRAELLAEMEGKKDALQKQVRVPESLGQSGHGSPAGRSVPSGGWRAKDLYD